jgi:hypothetical protein
MPEYVNPQIEKGLELNERGDRVFDEGTAARGRADDYIRTTVVLATVLFMLALRSGSTCCRSESASWWWPVD